MVSRDAERRRTPKVRKCQMDGCPDKAISAHIFCGRHAVSAEGVAFHKEIQAAATYLNAHEEAPTEDDLSRREAMDRFQRRVKRGDFTKLLDAATSKVLEQAAADRSYGLELGALRFAIARTLSEEQDAHRMSLAIARLANAVSRLALAEYGTRDPKPVVKYGEEWEPPLPGGEKLVHYIWRHRPADFEERYMARIDDPESLPWNIDRQIEADYRDSLQSDRANVDAEGKYLPPPLPEWRREGAGARRHEVEGDGLRVEGNDGGVHGDGGENGKLPAGVDPADEADTTGITSPEGAWSFLYGPTPDADEHP
jgi:hypothetical protein